ncbi:YggS family pyridoxal phosphate-dependent enzyme [Leucobacter denitrificans]|uniref:Pyridoxal phosphate homeostasis protein n=1 Tax=Leucobacter denitrificans TaxID=683042 RepID=A0A7G9S643_9MICO|nr:YggS family pyridoxal phosphate-dependent enzyme [Leucobacter denitrificans]QNN63318.1 YggS family pyridoxal phosphate-dependent enzyme [Leucobacter denitrificans]
MTAGVQVDDALRDRLLTVRSGIEEACRAAGRNSDEITLIVVTKFHPASLVTQLAELGVTDVGENRHQEAQEKAAELSDLELNWHFIGQLQTKKAKQAAQYASAIHSIDRAKLVDSLAGIDHTIDAFLQINLTDDPGRGGASPADIESLTERILETSTLRLRGVMSVAPLEEPAESAFERLAGYADRVRALAPDATSISAGMTHDYPAAIAAGATHLRIGSAITGNRPDAR